MAAAAMTCEGRTRPRYARARRAQCIDYSIGGILRDADIDAYDVDESNAQIVDRIIAGREVVEEFVRELLQALATARDHGGLDTPERAQGAAQLGTELLRMAIRGAVPSDEAGLQAFWSHSRLIERYALALADD